MQYFDAHCHLQDSRLGGILEEVFADYSNLGVGGVVVNGTRPSDWELVAKLADEHPVVTPSFGLHPWFVAEAGEGWKDELRSYWKRYPNSGIGELGLDRWVKGYDIEAQIEAFNWQLEFAIENHRFISIHCLKAWGLLLDALNARRGDFKNGFLLHSYGGPLEMINSFVNLGAYFSVSGYFALERKRKQAEAFRSIPMNRLLIETDAPDMRGPESIATYSAQNGVNDPRNLLGVYRYVSDLLEVSPDLLLKIVSDNWKRFTKPGAVG